MTFQLKANGKWYEVKHKSFLVALFRTQQTRGKVTEVRRVKG